MKAACIAAHGGNEVVHIGERRRPLRQPGEVLVRPVIDATYPLDALTDAFDRLDRGAQFGKLAIAIGSDIGS